MSIYLRTRIAILGLLFGVAVIIVGLILAFVLVRFQVQLMAEDRLLDDISALRVAGFETNCPERNPPCDVVEARAALRTRRVTQVMWSTLAGLSGLAIGGVTLRTSWRTLQRLAKEVEDGQTST
ncbi:MAG: hypothetical protein GYB68_00315 [Chloroflexi bacterium]|nr:hypothetical protein [Chloroflexota bacterium]